MQETPYYLVNYNLFKDNCVDLMQAFKREWGDNLVFGYSVKTNSYQGLLEYAYHKLGWYGEVVSPDEYHYCMEAKVDPSKIIFNGPCKGRLLRYAFEKGAYINLDHLEEAEELCKNVDLRGIERVGLRVNFDLESVCPGETTAGNSVSRFGIDGESSDFRYVLELLNRYGLKKIGLHMHTSTKTRSLAVFRALANQAVDLIEKYEMEVPYIDIGGGFFGGQIVAGKPLMKEYAKEICDILKRKVNPGTTTLILEPGACVLATCVSYITKVINIRKIRNVDIVTLDGTLLHINPFMHPRKQPFEVTNMGDENREDVERQILCGCTCMENDRLGELVHTSELKVEDLLEFKNAGAYTMAFNSHFIIEPPKVKTVGNCEMYRDSLSIFWDATMGKNQKERRHTLLDTLNRLGKRIVPPLDHRVDIELYAEKIMKFGNVMYLTDHAGIYGIAAFYANDKERKTAYLTFLAVSESINRKGYGAKLLKEVEKGAYHLGMDFMKLEVDNNNYTAIEFYGKMGFQKSSSASGHSVYMIKKLEEMC